MIKSKAKITPKPGITLNQQIKDWLIREFENFSLDEKLPTDRALAKDLQVSPVTVNKAMNQLCQEGYVVRRQGQGTFLASRERQVNKSLSGKSKNGQIIIAYPNYFSSEYWLRLQASEELAVKNAYDLIEYKLNRIVDFDNLLEIAKKQDDLKGILLKPIPETFSRQVLKKLDALGIPVILFQPCDYITLGENFYSISNDQFKLDYMKIKYLLDHGHRKIAIISNEPAARRIERLSLGYRQALEDYNLTPKDIIRSADKTQAWANSAEAAYELTKKVMSKNDDITALTFDSVTGALGGMRYLWERKLWVPDDISIISIGGGRNFEEFMPAPVTVVRIPIDQQAAVAFDIIQNPEDFPTKTILCSPEIVERESVKRI